MAAARTLNRVQRGIRWTKNPAACAGGYLLAGQASASAAYIPVNPQATSKKKDHAESLGMLAGTEPFAVFEGIGTHVGVAP